MAVVWASWWALVVLGPPSLHACPDHGGAHHASHLMAHAPSSAHHSGGSKDAGGDHCKCVGDCCVSALSMPARTFHYDAPAVVAATQSIPFGAGAAATLREHALPFANGPPSQIAQAV
jgi:hypothetical protein